MPSVGEGSEKKRKLHDGPEIEIDVSAPEPPSKKALRKAKKNKGAESTDAPQVETNTQAPANQEDSSKQQRSDYGIWIGNLGFFVTKDDLRQFFTSNCSFTDATITRIHMPKGAEKFGKAQNKGFAYVDFSNVKALNEALGLSEQLLSGRRVLIKNAKSFEGRPEKSEEEKKMGSATASGHAPSRRIFVGNLSFDVTKEAIEEHFSRCGTLTHVHVATFQDTGKCKGFAWVEFEELAAAEAAVKGYVMVSEDDEEDEEEGEDEGSESAKRKPAKKPKQKKIWVNQLLGRRMRMEFAEDATTRYKKRFGKEGEGKRNDGAEVTEVDNDHNATGEQPAQRRPAKARQQKPEYTRYDQQTVQKLSGAIVEAQGKKTTFD